MHQMIDKVRNQREDRKLLFRQYDQTETRRRWILNRDKSRYHRQISSTLATDTGFDVICSSCLQYKSKSFCKPIEKLNEAKQNKFIIKMCSLLKNRYDGQMVCNICFNEKNGRKITHKDTDFILHPHR